jgi:hypothetical protein
MVNTQKSYIRLERQTKNQLRTMLADAQSNTKPEDFPIAVKVPDKKRTLPTRLRQKN